MTRIPLAYPKMPGSRDAPLTRCVAFEKLDGTNLHWMFDPELGWHAFGTRRDRFDLDDAGIQAFHDAHPGLAEAPELFLSQLAQPLLDMLNARYSSCESFIVFTEFLGEHSFAGQHVAHEPKRLAVIDAMCDAQLVAPQQFVEAFAAVEIPRVVYEGRLTGKFATDVREGRYNVEEGVVCKGVTREGEVWMVKIKTNAYQQKLLDSFGEQWEQYWE